MTASTRDLLDAFDRLPDPERHEFTVEILRRTSQHGLPNLEDEELVLAANDLFHELDDREAANAHSQPG